jgi:hypothetical protein
MKQKQEKFEDTKRIIISQKSKDRQYNGQNKKDKQCLTFKKNIVKIEMVIVDFIIITVQIKSWGWGIPLNDLTPPPFCACPKPEPGFTTLNP